MNKNLHHLKLMIRNLYFVSLVALLQFSLSANAEEIPTITIGNTITPIETDLYKLTSNNLNIKDVKSEGDEIKVKVVVNNKNITTTIGEGVNICDGSSFIGPVTNNGTISGGDFTAISVTNNADAIINGGTFVNVTNYGTINDGTFEKNSEGYGGVSNFYKINGGTFKANVGNNTNANGRHTGFINGGTFSGNVSNGSTQYTGQSTINGGIFNCNVTNNKKSGSTSTTTGVIAGGVFTKNVTNNGQISSGIFCGDISGDGEKNGYFIKDGNTYTACCFSESGYITISQATLYTLKIYNSSEKPLENATFNLPKNCSGIAKNGTCEDFLVGTINQYCCAKKNYTDINVTTLNILHDFDETTHACKLLYCYETDPNYKKINIKILNNSNYCTFKVGDETYQGSDFHVWAKIGEDFNFDILTNDNYIVKSIKINNVSATNKTITNVASNETYTIDIDITDFELALSLSKSLETENADKIYFTTNDISGINFNDVYIQVMNSSLHTIREITLTKNDFDNLFSNEDGCYIFPLDNALEGGKYYFDVTLYNDDETSIANNSIEFIGGILEKKLAIETISAEHLFFNFPINIDYSEYFLNTNYMVKVISAEDYNKYKPQTPDDFTNQNITTYLQSSGSLVSNNIALNINNSLKLNCNYKVLIFAGLDYKDMAVADVTLPQYLLYCDKKIAKGGDDLYFNFAYVSSMNVNYINFQISDDSGEIVLNKNTTDDTTNEEFYKINSDTGNDVTIMFFTSNINNNINITAGNYTLTATIYDKEGKVIGKTSKVFTIFGGNEIGVNNISSITTTTETFTLDFDYIGFGSDYLTDNNISFDFTLWTAKDYNDYCSNLENYYNNAAQYGKAFVSKTDINGLIYYDIIPYFYVDPDYYYTTITMKTVDNLIAGDYKLVLIEYNDNNSNMKQHVFDVKVTEATPTAIKVVKAESNKTIKTIKDGQIVIIRDGVMYDMQGRKL